MKTLPLIGILFVSLFTAGCTTTRTVIVDNTKIIVAAPPKSLLVCSKVPAPPKGDTLTNKQVAEYVSTLRRELEKCGVNMRKVDQYISELKKKYNQN